MIVENQSHKAIFYGEAVSIPEQNPKLADMWFVQSEEKPDQSFLQSLEAESNIKLPQLFLEFISQCGGFYADINHSYPCAFDDMTKSLKLSFNVVDDGQSRSVIFSLFEGFDLPGSGGYHHEADILKRCFGLGDYEDTLNGRDWTKLIPFASDNGDVLCLDFSAEGEPEIVYITYDGVGVYFAFSSFEQLLLALDF